MEERIKYPSAVYLGQALGITLLVLTSLFTVGYSIEGVKRVRRWRKERTLGNPGKTKPMSEEEAYKKLAHALHVKIKQRGQVIPSKKEKARRRKGRRREAVDD